ncbi:hypothetical protein D3C74_420760 [compost metagenome]
MVVAHGDPGNHVIELLIFLFLDIVQHSAPAGAAVIGGVYLAFIRIGKSDIVADAVIAIIRVLVVALVVDEGEAVGFAHADFIGHLMPILVEQLWRRDLPPALVGPLGRGRGGNRRVLAFNDR